MPVRRTTLLFTVLRATFCLSTASAQDRDAKIDSKALEGTWKVTDLEIGGKKMRVGGGSPEKVVIRGGKITIWTKDGRSDRSRTASWNSTPKRSPKRSILCLRTARG